MKCTNYELKKILLCSLGVTLSCAFLLSSSLYGVVFPSKKQSSYTTDIKDLKPSLNIETIDNKKNILMSSSMLKTRVEKSQTTPEIEPVGLKIPKDKKERMIYAGRIAKDGFESNVLKILNSKINKALKDPNEQKSKLSYVKIELDSYLARIIKLNVFAKDYEASTHDLVIKTKTLPSKLKKQLFNQVEEYLSEDRQTFLTRKIKAGKPLNVKEDLLPPFATKMIDKFTPFKGPNCFHAALAFQGENFAKAGYVNIKKQKGYHDYMINYDELWDTINHYFYEINPKLSPLKYGDMIVFFDITNPSSFTNPHYTWIKHTATYLFSNYTFSKGSKSANTAYTIKTLDEEWTTWHKYVKNLGIKVFRKNNKYATKQLPKELNEWIY